jgi:hypothetical protein
MLEDPRSQAQGEVRLIMMLIWLKFSRHFF